MVHGTRHLPLHAEYASLRLLLVGANTCQDLLDAGRLVVVYLVVKLKLQEIFAFRIVKDRLKLLAPGQQLGGLFPLGLSLVEAELQRVGEDGLESGGSGLGEAASGSENYEKRHLKRESRHTDNR